MRWVQKYISNFGGDPSKVTMYAARIFSCGYVTNLLSSWGESSGAVSVAMHMLANDGDTEGLFRAAFMQSGSPVPVGPLENGQLFYDQIVQQVGCAGSPASMDSSGPELSFRCLNRLPAGQLSLWNMYRSNRCPLLL
ncbi:Alpha/Beta hydrolase protein [Mycena pura]|uniref:Alpha/Beta hydrolase protein n=1 Tax=Mycena pura TaxID=153505 RepID=A0AAD6YVH4_9AGAR|nr:Alpha/Beta hydrolase protein [Mycena pura]